MEFARQRLVLEARRAAILLATLYLSVSALAVHGLAQSVPPSPTQSLYTLPEGVETRWASPENPKGEKGKGALSNSGRKGRAAIGIKAGEQVTLAEVHGTSGTVRRIWITINDRSPAMLRGLKVDMFWDGAAKPAVSAPLGDFFGFALGRMAAFQSALFAGSRGQEFQLLHSHAFQERHEDRGDERKWQRPSAFLLRR